MAKDYKHRVRGKNTLNPQDFDPVESLSVWKWMLITAAAILLVVLIVRFSGIGQKEEVPKTVAQQQVKTEPEKKPEPEEPEVKAVQFDFYTILPEKEVVVPEYEIKTRTREERIGQAKATQYILQAGSYNGRKEAELMLDRLAKMGIEAKIQKATVGSKVWYRVKLGPFAQIASVNSINTRLKQNGIDAIVTETDK
jgi:cell division protein FtsN